MGLSFERKFLRGGVLTALMAVTFLLGIPKTFAATFNDVPKDHPNYSAIESLKNLGVVKGYSDGSFMPDRAVNRAEALKMVLLTAKVNVPPGLYQTDFPDVSLSDWFGGYVFYGQNLLIVSGNPDGTFAPGRQVNKAEFLKMTEQALRIDLSGYQDVQFALSRDIVNVSEWYVPYFNFAKSVGVVLPNIENKLEPGKYLSRAECAEILYKMYIIINGGQVQELLSAAEAKLVDALIRVNENNIADALTRAQEAVFYTDSAAKLDPSSDVAQGANLMAKGFQKLFEAYGAGAENDTLKLKTLTGDAKSYADQAVAKDATLQDLAQKLKDLAAGLELQAGV